MTASRTKVLTLLMALGAVLAGCRAQDSAPARDRAAPAADEPLAEGGCSWIAANDPDLVNVAFPDEDAHYWLAELPFAPGVLRYRVEGIYPDARYFSYNAYDNALRPTDAIADYRIAPDTAGTNPYQTAGAPPGGGYTMFVLPQAVPEQRAPNTLYAGSTTLPGGNAGPNPRVSIIYRTYVPVGDAAGSVALPRIVAETASGDQTLVGLSPCTVFSPPANAVLNDTIREASFPAPAAAPFPFTTRAPKFRRFYGLPETARVLLSIALGQEVPPNQATAGDGGGFLSNRDNAYMNTMFSRDKASLYVVRAKAPTYLGDPRLAGAAPQLRYWSFCTNEFFSQRYVECLRDSKVALDAEGYFTFVVSDPDDRPANATPENGFNWLPWGGAYYDSVAIYRHMLPDAAFAEAVQNVPYGADAAEVMREYFPRTAYCDRATVEAAGTSPRAAFDACAGRAT
ncbi:MAG: hypothetical protein HYV18_05560 [Gammaproteobacteria bacterium]|nr:hypothetical protein [Gammaproteobacteria bacterium]